MIERINQVLADHGENYIMPFFWQHGEEEPVLRDYMRAIQDCGIEAVCVESRPHPDFCGDQWWHDMDIILDEARTRNMKVWILDDAHFPTGQANGAMDNAPKELCKQYLFYNVIDISGPTPSAELNIARLSHRITPPLNSLAWVRALAISPDSPAPDLRSTIRKFDDDEFLAVVAAKAVGKGIDASTLIDITDHVNEHQILRWDVPAGFWRVFVLYRTRNGMGATNYINMLSFQSCTKQLEAVYEPHWRHYATDFGKTIAGFFSDEPALGNINGGYENWIGNPVPISWSDEVEAELKARLGKDYLRLMPAIWYSSSSDGETARIRYIYMDVITRLVEKDFSLQIGNWCAAHGVQYIGHTIEDNNQHARMGQSLGHQFRGLAGQHMGGVDCIGDQVYPAKDVSFRSGSFIWGSASPERDGEFYHYILGKLASSNGHLDPRKQGNSMCEIFGDYGWEAGTRLEKYLTDHFLVRGVNHFVPHAFSPKPFPDRDCPPHFYAHGYNPLYRPFGKLMHYMNRMCHLLSGGTHHAPVGLLYHAEAEWSGREDGYMLMQKPAHILLDNQIDFDILWSDLFVETDRFDVKLDAKVLKVGSETFRALVVPYTKYVTRGFATFASLATRIGFPVIFVDALPVAICGEADGTDAIAALGNCLVCSLEELPTHLKRVGAIDVLLEHPFPFLRYIRYSHENELFMFSNESVSDTFCGKVTVPTVGTPVFYDAMENRTAPVEYISVKTGTTFQLKLEPYQSIVIAFNTGITPDAPIPFCNKKTSLTGPWTLSYSDALNRAFDQFTETYELGMAKNLENLGISHPNFSGVVRYTTRFQLPANGTLLLELENAYEAAEVTVNGKKTGMAICPPYRFNLTGLVHPGENELAIDVFTTLDRVAANMPDRPDELPGLPVLGFKQPYGLVGEVWLLSP